MTYIPEIFKPTKPIDFYLSTHFDDKSSIWHEFICQVEIIIPNEINQFKKIKLNTNLNSIPSPQKEIFIAGRGRYEIRNGNFITGAKLIGHAYKSLNGCNPEIQAYLILEMVSFLGIIGNFEIAQLLLPQVRFLTNNEFLINIAKYYEMVQEMRTGKLNIISDLKKSSNYFNKVGANSIEIYHLKIIGNLYRRKGNYEKAETVYNKAIGLTLKNNLPHVSSSITHDIGLLQYYMGNPKVAIETLEKELENINHPYTKSFIHSTLGFLNLKLNNLNDSKEEFQSALVIISFYGIFQMEPGLCFYLAQIYEKYQNLNLAKYYYERANQSANELIKQNFPYNGDRAKAILGYINFIKKYPHIKGLPLESEDLSFCIDLKMDEIRNIFHYHFLNRLIELNGTIRKASKQIDLAERTFHHIKQRTNQCEIEIPEIVIHFFISQNKLNWKEINTKFDQNISVYLANYYGSKQKASKKLGLSYTHFVKMTNR